MFHLQRKYAHLIEDSLTLSKRVVQLDMDIDVLKANVRKLEEESTKLQEQNVMGAYNMIKERVNESKENQQKVHKSFIRQTTTTITSSLNDNENIFNLQ